MARQCSERAALVHVEGHARAEGGVHDGADVIRPHGVAPLLVS